MQLPFAVAPHSLGTVTTGNETTSRPAIHLGEFKSRGMVWKSNGNTNLWVRGNFGSAKPVDFFSVLSANAQSGTTIRLRLGDTQAEVDGTADYDSGAQTFISPARTREDGLYHSHFELPSVQTKQWWRIDISGHTGDFQASSLVMGQKLTPATYYNPDFEFGLEDQGSLEWTRYGVASEEDGVLMRKLKLTFSWLSQSDYETKFRPLTEKVGKRGMVYFCFDPDPTVYRQSKTYFGVLTDPPFATGAAPKQTNYEMSFELLSLI